MFFVNGNVNVRVNGTCVMNHDLCIIFFWDGMGHDIIYPARHASTSTLRDHLSVLFTLQVLRTFGRLYSRRTLGLHSLIRWSFSAMWKWLIECSRLLGWKVEAKEPGQCCLLGDTLTRQRRRVAFIYWSVLQKTELAQNIRWVSTCLLYLDLPPTWGEWL